MFSGIVKNVTQPCLMNNKMFILGYIFTHVYR